MLRLRFVLLLTCCFAFLSGSAQISEHFTDGDFTNNPTWVGDTAEWDVNVQRLQLDGIATGGVTHLSTPCTSINNAVWEFNVELLFNPSGSNFVDVYLVSDIPDLEGSVNGYYVRMGGTTDEISLWVDNNGSGSEIIDGTDDRLDVSNPIVKVMVTRMGNGDWTLWSDTSGTGTNYFQEGQTTDAQHTQSAHFGISTQYTSTRRQWCFLDSVEVTGTAFQDTVKPVVLSVTAIASDSLAIQFSENVDVATATTVGNYLRNGTTAPMTATIDGVDSSLVRLAFATPFPNCINETIDIANVEDRNGNAMNPATEPYLWCQAGTAVFKSVIINEIAPDPSPAPNCIPAAEYVELYNRGTVPVDLMGWTLSDNTTPDLITATSYFLLPGDYVILCSDTSLFNSFGPAIEMALPGLNNAGDALGLRDNNFTLIDTVDYEDTWYQDAVKDDGGWSLELINPTDTCSGGGTNWIASVDTCGGTPGQQNSVFSTTPDVTSPAIVSVVVTGPTTVQVCFDEPVDPGPAATAGFYVASGNLGTATFAAPVGPDFLCVDLTFGTPIDTGTTYTLTATGVPDCHGNSAATMGSFIVTGPALWKDIIFNEVFPDPDSSLTNMPPIEFAELHNRSASVYDLGGWTFSDIGSPHFMPNYILQPGDYVIICLDEDTTWFSGLPVLGLGSWPSLNNSGDQLGLRDLTGNLIDSLEYDDGMYQDDAKDDGGWTLELINPDDTCSTFGNWIASNDPDGGTPGAVNSVFDNTPDIQAPSIVSVTVTSANTVQVCFDETMDAIALADANNYTVDNGLNGPSNAAPVAPMLACVDLTFAAPIDTGTIYTITFTNITDCAGNSVGILRDTFVLGGSAAPFEIIINELFADETPSVALPEAEFIELHNTGNGVVDLNQWTLTDRTSTVATFPSYNMFPGDYVIICANADVDTFSTYGPTLGVSNFPSLNNGGDSLELYNGAGTLIDFVYYDDDWYQDEAKEDGGWTLERIDPGFTCLNSGNWRASEDASGGTPGRQNSVLGTFTDDVAPEVVSAIVLDPTMIRLYFNEVMDGSTLTDPAQYTIDNGIGNPIAVSTPGAVPFSIELMLGSSLDTNTIYCVTVTGVDDCPGNDIGSGTVCFGIPVTVEAGDLVINEILFNPYTGGSDFVELYNVSNKIIDMSTINIGEVFEGTDSIFNSDQVSSVPVLLLPESYICLTADKQVQLETYLPIDPDAIFEMNSFPSYDDGDGECVIWTDSGTVIDRLMYLDDWHFPNLDDDNGVSLERHDFFRATQDEDNWHSAASTALYATPGYKNSQILVPSGTEEVWLEPETFSPDQDGRDDVLSVNYNFPGSGWNAKITVFDSKGRLVRILQQNTLLGTEGGTFTWDGTTDAGNKTDVGVYVLLFEATNPNTGERKNFKLGVVVAANL